MEGASRLLSCLAVVWTIGGCGGKSTRILPGETDADTDSDTGSTTGTSTGTECGQTLCGADCVNLQTDEANCGTCGYECGAGASCDGGRCLCNGAECRPGEDCVNGA